jgi:4a-hydroxytetrahydrobiopterin dehydratase
MPNIDSITPNLPDPSAALLNKKCLPCEGGVEPLSLEQATQLLAQLPGWQISYAGQRIRKAWRMKSFLAGLEFFQAVGALAEAEQHHPDLHLESYRELWIEIWTHAIGGLSENDFILAAKIDQLPKECR